MDEGTEAIIILGVMILGGGALFAAGAYAAWSLLSLIF